MTIFLLFTFCNYIILGGDILDISKTLFRKLIFHLLLSLISLYKLYSLGGISYKFKVCNISLHFVQSVNIKDSLHFLLKHACVGKFTFKKFRLLKKKNFFLSWLLKVNQFFQPLGYFCYEVIILILFLIKFMGASFFLDFFN